MGDGADEGERDAGGLVGEDAFEVFCSHCHYTAGHCRDVLAANGTGGLLSPLCLGVIVVVVAKPLWRIKPAMRWSVYAT